jgi:hypothetical protein
MNFDKYKDKYPTYLYFTDDAFNEVIKRNKLEISTPEAYIGHIPERCLDAILNENIQGEDIRPNMHTAKIESLNTGYCFTFNCADTKKKEIENWSTKDIENQLIEYPTNGRMLSRNEAEGLLYGDKVACLFNVSFTFQDKDFSQLYIAAPASMIDASKAPKKSFLERTTITKQIQASDPIVFRYVKDGILVITFWE